MQAVARPGEESGAALAARRDRIRHIDVTAADIEAEMRSSGRWDARQAMISAKLLAMSKGGSDITINRVRVVELCPGCDGSINTPVPEEAITRSGNGPLWHVRCFNADREDREVIQ